MSDTLLTSKLNRLLKNPRYKKDKALLSFLTDIARIAYSICTHFVEAHSSLAYCGTPPTGEALYMLHTEKEKVTCPDCLALLTHLK